MAGINEYTKIRTDKLKEEILDVLTIVVNSVIKDSRIVKLTEISGSSPDSIDVKLPYYSVFVDKGRKPGKMPPVNVIAKWANRKGIPNPNKAAWAIAKSIAKRGIEPRPFLKRFESNMNMLVNDYIDDIFTEITK